MAWMVGVWIKGGTRSARPPAMMEFSGKGLVGYGNQIAAEAGLLPDPAHFCKFSDSNLATVSINWLRGG